MSSKSIKAFAPANISCFFKVYKHKNPRWAGSFGMGFTIDEGVAVSVTESKKTAILFNKKKITFPTVVSVIKKLTQQKVVIEINSKLPLGCGFGLSGASALAAAYAINKLLGLRKTKRDLTIIAHTAEVENKTGLGDIVNQFYGGFFLKLKPSSYFEVKRFSFADTPVYCKYYSKITTSNILSDKLRMGRVNRAGNLALAKAMKAKTFGELIAVSKEFAIESGLLTHAKTKQTIADIEKKGGHASMIMLGNAVYSDIPFMGAIKLKISDKGARLL